MLRLNKKQKEILGQTQYNVFLNNLNRHLHQYFPEMCSKLGKDYIKKAIEYGMSGARKYGWYSEKALCNYIDIMFTHGKDFDTQCVWAKRYLQKALEMGTGPNIDVLFQLAIGHGKNAKGIEPEEFYGEK